MGKNNKISELDGWKEFPFVYFEGCEESTWERKVLELIKNRVGDGKDIRFNLMAIVSDPRESLRNEILTLNSEIDSSNNRTELLTRRFKAQQELDDAESKWKEFRKVWDEGKKNNFQIQKFS